MKPIIILNTRSLGGLCGASQTKTVAAGQLEVGG